MMRRKPNDIFFNFNKKRLVFICLIKLEVLLHQKFFKTIFKFIIKRP